MEKSTGQLVTIEPIHDPDFDNILKADNYREAHVQCGWVRSVGADCHEDLNEDDLIVFVGWKQKGIEPHQYAQWKDNLYVLHEDDIELIVKEW